MRTIEQVNADIQAANDKYHEALRPYSLAYSAAIKGLMYNHPDYKAAYTKYKEDIAEITNAFQADHKVLTVELSAIKNAGRPAANARLVELVEQIKGPLAEALKLSGDYGLEMDITEDGLSVSYGSLDHPDWNGSNC